MKNKTVTSIMRNSAESPASETRPSPVNSESEMKAQQAALQLSSLRMLAIVAVRTAHETWLFELKSNPCPSCEAQDTCDVLRRWEVELGVTQVARPSWSPHPEQLVLPALLAMEKWRQAKGEQS